MTLMRKITGTMNHLLTASAAGGHVTNGHVTSSHCKRCGRETRWLVHLGRGYFRCLECRGDADERPQ